MEKLKSRSAMRNRNSSFQRQKILACYNDGRTVSPVNKRKLKNRFEEDQYMFKPQTKSNFYENKTYNNYNNSMTENNSVEASTDENAIKYTKKKRSQKSKYKLIHSNTDNIQSQKQNPPQRSPFANNLKSYLQKIGIKENQNQVKSDIQTKSLRKQIHMRNNLERVSSINSNSNSRSFLKFSQINDSFKHMNMDDTHLYSDIAEFEHLNKQIEGLDQTAQFQSNSSNYKLEDKQDSEIVRAYQMQKLQKIQEIYYQHLKDHNENEINAKIILSCLTPEQQIDYMQKIIANSSKQKLLNNLSSQTDIQNVFKDHISNDIKNKQKSIDQILSHDDNLMLMMNTQGSFELRPTQEKQKIQNVKQKMQTMQELMDQLQNEVQTLDQQNPTEKKLMTQFENMISQINHLKDQKNINKIQDQQNIQNQFNKKPQLKIMTTAREQKTLRGLDIQQTPKLEKINIRVSKSPQRTYQSNNYHMLNNMNQISQFKTKSPQIKYHLQNLQKPQFELKPNFKQSKLINQQKEVYKYSQDTMYNSQIQNPNIKINLKHNNNKYC